MLFHTHIFGPIHSRRLGNSLGINLLPNEGKVCSFDCIYCECGLNRDGRADTVLASRAGIRQELEDFLLAYTGADKPAIDTFTFAGNGEPTVHPEFAGIVDDVILLRNRYQPDAVVSVLTNAWQLDREEVCGALLKVDNCILKLDSAVSDTVRRINQPVNPHFDLDAQIARLARFSGRCVVQTMFLRGLGVDNTTDAEVEAWIQALRRIAPRQVQLYSLDRPAPVADLQKVPVETLRSIAARVEQYGLETQVVG
ncbi:MAG: radical SAM protein [Paludibacteraceae bacterium]|nr:radical SAM protein [Paludibacteraceae bacterium]